MSDTPMFDYNPQEKPGEPGNVEAAFIKQMDHLQELRIMTSAHAGLRALVLRTARAVDEIGIKDAASGRAQLLKALSDVASQLPQPDASEVSVIDKLIELFAHDTDEPGPYDNPPETDA